MPDELTAEERAAIARYLETNNIKRIPCGKSGATVGRLPNESELRKRFFEKMALRRKNRLQTDRG